MLPWWLSGKKSTCNAGDMGLIPALGRSPGGGHGNPLQYSCLENSMDRGAWQDAIHSAEKNRTRLSYWTTTYWKYSKNTYWIRVYFPISFSIWESKVKVKVAQSCPTLCDPMDYTVSPGQNTGVDSLLQGIFPTQELNRGLLHCGQIFYQLSYKGSPYLRIVTFIK